MPIYEYECSNCHQQFDLLQKISDEPTSQCPQCHKDTAVRLVSAAAFQLKGSGWYATDFKNKPETKKTETSSSKPASDKKSVDSTTPATSATSSSKGDKD